MSTARVATTTPSAVPLPTELPRELGTCSPSRLPLHDPERLLLIAGPCSLESEAVCRTVAEELVRLRDAQPALNIVFKGSFDKANRTSISGPRGMGLEAGLELLALVKRDYGFPVLTDIHERGQAAPVAEVCDVLQIPAFLCRQTDLLLAAAQTGRVVNVKKGQFLSPQEMAHVAAKIRGAASESASASAATSATALAATGAEARAATEVWQTERGTTFGYQNLVVDMRTFPILRANGLPTIFDATHSVQLPGAGGGKSAGQREFVPPLARAALAAGADGLFIETHPDPDRAPSDGPNMVYLHELAGLIETCLAIWRFSKPESLSK